MAQALKNDCKSNIDGDTINLEKRLCIKFNEIPNLINKNIETFIWNKTLIFFIRFNINFNFIETSPSTWESNEKYKRGKEIVSKLKVVNDTAERAVKLIEDFN